MQQSMFRHRMLQVPLLNARLRDTEFAADELKTLALARWSRLLVPMEPLASPDAPGGLGSNKPDAACNIGHTPVEFRKMHAEPADEELWEALNVLYWREAPASRRCDSPEWEETEKLHAIFRRNVIAAETLPEAERVRMQIECCPFPHAKEARVVSVGWRE